MVDPDDEPDAVPPPVTVAVLDAESEPRPLAVEDADREEDELRLLLAVGVALGDDVGVGTDRSGHTESPATQTVHVLAPATVLYVPNAQEVHTKDVAPATTPL